MHLKRYTTQLILFHHIGQYCSIYDYELLVAFVQSTGCQDAIKLLDDFTKTLSTSILSDLHRKNIALMQSPFMRWNPSVLL